MESLDYKYIAKLVTRAHMGDSDAFAELYAATYQREYLFSYRYLRDEYLAQDALQETYILALKNLSKLKDPMLVISWLNQINFRVCYNLQKNISVIIRKWSKAMIFWILSTRKDTEGRGIVETEIQRRI